MSASIRTLSVVVDQSQRFEKVYREHSGAVRAFVHRRAAAEIADDVVAEVFAAAWRRVDEMPEQPLLWLFGIARGLIANARRAENRRRALSARLQATTLPAVQAGPEGRTEDLDAVLSAFGSLRETDRELLRLIAWEGLDRPQAAQVLGVGLPVLSLRLHRARRRLARALDAAESENPRPVGAAPTKAA